MQIQRASQTKTAEAGRHSRPASSVAPAFAPVHPILQLQQTIGNQAVQRLLRSRKIQAKLSINQPGDIYEQEADRVAERVVRMPEPAIQRACSACATGGATCSKCETEKRGRVQRKTERVSESSDSVPDDFVTGLGPGQPLDPTTRAFFEPRFGQDFSQVRVHTDAKAAESAQAVNALAYTVGRDVVFSAGQFAPGTNTGQRLLAHELTHVVQQGNQTIISNSSLVAGAADSPSELEADRVADALGRDSGSSIQHRISRTIQRAIRFSPNSPLTIGHWTAGATTVAADTAEIVHGDFEASAEVHVEADTAGELANWEVGFLQNDQITWSRSYWTRTNADRRGRFLERKLRVPSVPLRDHANAAIVWAAPGEFRDVATAAGGALSADIPLTSSDEPTSRRSIHGSSQAGADASDGTDNIFQYRQGDNFISFVSAHNTATDEWRHLELIYWSVQDSVDFAADPAGGVRITRDDRSLGQSRRFRWTPAADQPAIGASLSNDYVNDPANTSVRRVERWT